MTILFSFTFRMILGREKRRIVSIIFCKVKYITQWEHVLKLVYVTTKKQKLSLGKIEGLVGHVIHMRGMRKTRDCSRLCQVRDKFIYETIRQSWKFLVIDIK